MLQSGAGRCAQIHATGFVSSKEDRSTSAGVGSSRLGNQLGPGEDYARRGADSKGPR